MYNAHLYNSAIYNEGPQWLLEIDKHVDISIAEYTKRSLKCYVDLYDSISVSDIVDEILPILYKYLTETISVTEFTTEILPLLYKSVVDSVNITDIIEKYIEILLLSTQDNISIVEQIWTFKTALKFRFNIKIDELMLNNITDELKFKVEA